MKVLFVGLGSIGKRHLDDLIDILSERGEELIADRVSHSDTPLPDKLAAVIRNDNWHVGKIGEGLTANTEVSL